MKEIIKIFLKACGSKLVTVILTLAKTANSFFDYQSKKIDVKQQETHTKKVQEFEKKIDNVTNKGSIQDLLDL